MQYMLFVWHEADFVVDFTTAEAMELVEQVGAFNAELQRTGALVHAGGLQPRGEAMTARWTGGDVEASPTTFLPDGPLVGGFWIVDVPDRATAEALTRRAAQATRGNVELRPLQQG